MVAPPDGIAKRTALVLYGSETGNAQDVAEEIGRLLERLRFVTKVAELDSVQLVRAHPLDNYCGYLCASLQSLTPLSGPASSL